MGPLDGVGTFGGGDKYKHKVICQTMGRHNKTINPSLSRRDMFRNLFRHHPSERGCPALHIATAEAPRATSSPA